MNARRAAALFRRLLGGPGVPEDIDIEDIALLAGLGG